MPSLDCKRIANNEESDIERQNAIAQAVEFLYGFKPRPEPQWIQTVGDKPLEENHPLAKDPILC
jgi:hypothetical protein